LPERSERVRRSLCLVKANDDLLASGRRDLEAVLAERPHLHVAPRCLDP
jgi:hypothetical protein